MIIVTGGAGFIGSAIIAELNNRNITDIIVVDQLGSDLRYKNLINLQFKDYIEKDTFLKMVTDNEMPSSVKFIFHMGACSDTTETDASYLIENNYEYTKTLATWCANNRAHLIYASSAATYGDGENSFKDDDTTIENLKPLNMYGYSKQLFDLWAKKSGLLGRIVGLKYFNVFGPNEYHKANMRSFILKAFEQIKSSDSVKLFKSGNPEYQDGQYVRDFIYIKDAVDMTLFFMDNTNIHGLFNIGTGKARSWNDLVKAVFTAMGKEPKIQYVDMPNELKNQYQYYTQADMHKMVEAGYKGKLHSLESAVKDYVKNYLNTNSYLGPK